MPTRTLAILSIASLAITSPALAAGLKTDQITIDRDLLVTPAGVETVYAALKATAESVCDASKRPISLRAFSQSRNCIETTLDKAVADVAHPELTAWHERQRQD